MKKIIFVFVLFVSIGFTNTANAQDPLIGEVKMFAGNFAPRGWAFCDGQLLAISQHSALFSLLGTTYGGDGRTTFALPDLRGRVPVHAGNGPGLTPRRLGEKGGSERIVLSRTQLSSEASNVNDKLPMVNDGEGSKAVSTMQPYTTINYIIALQGIYPSRS